MTRSGFAAETRDSLWDQPDLMPGADDIDDPSGVIARLQGVGELDEMDLALQELLDDAERGEGGEPEPGEAGTERGEDEPKQD